MKNIRLFTLVAICMLLITSLNAQPWYQAEHGWVDDERGFSGVQTTNQTYVNAGRTFFQGAATTDAVLTEVDPCNGNVLIQLNYGDPGVNDEFRAVREAMLNFQGYACVGYTDRTGDDQGYFVLTDLSGAPIFTTLVGDNGGDERLFDVIETSDGGFAMCGYTTSLSGDQDAYVVKYDAGLSVQWTVAIGTSPGNDRAVSLIENFNNNSIIVTGGTQSLDIHGGAGDILVAELDLGSGGVIANHIFVYGDVGVDNGRDVTIVGSDIFVTGESNSNSIGQFDFFWLHLDASFIPANYNQWGLGDQDRARSIEYNPSTGEFGIAGFENSATFGGFDGFLALVDMNGSLNSAIHYGTNANDRIIEMTLDLNQSDFVMTGWTNFLNQPLNGDNFWSLQADPGGSTGCFENGWNPIQSGNFPNYADQVKIQSAPDDSQINHNPFDIPWVIDQFCLTNCKKGASDRNLTPSESLLSMAPNPATSRITFGYGGEESIATINIMDVQGRTTFVKEGLSGMEAYELNLDQFEAGVYFVKAMLTNGEIVVGRFVKQ